MVKSFRKKRKINGFTLIEIIVSISIITLMTSLFLANYRDTNKRTELTYAAQNLASDIRLAQNYGLGLRDFKTLEATGGWGVNMSEGDSYYTVFADLNDDATFQEGERFLRVDFARGITVSNIDIGNELNITFKPPRPTVWINGNKNTKAEITLANTEGSESKLQINFFGLIDVLN